MTLGTGDLPRTAVPPPPLGYATPLPRSQPPRTLAGTVTALSVGVLLLVLALGPLLYIARAMNVPPGMAPHGADWDVAMQLLAMFAGVCTIISLVFLIVGLRWLGSASRARA